MLTCKEFLQELSDYLDENIDAEVKARLEEHIALCPNCWVVCDTTKRTIKIYKGFEPYSVPADVESRLFTLLSAYQAIAVQTKSRDAARDQLRLAQDRYRLGSGTSLEVSDAQNAVQRAEGDYVTAVYVYHKSMTALEAAVGRPLR